MENEGEKCQKTINILDSEENIETKELIFKIEYPNKKLDNNKEYIEWKNSMMKKYGNNSKEFKCLKDNILYYINYKNYLSNEFNGKCPICGINICYFCLSLKAKNCYEWESCCLKKSIYRAFFINGLKFCKNNVDNYIYNACFRTFIFLPGINIFFTILKIIDILFLDVGIKKTLYNGKNDNFDCFRSRIHKYPIMILPYFLFLFMISIILFIYNIYFIIIVLLISIPFKYYPIKYIYGIIIANI